MNKEHVDSNFTKDILAVMTKYVDMGQRLPELASSLQQIVFGLAWEAVGRAGAESFIHAILDDVINHVSTHPASVIHEE